MAALKNTIGVQIGLLGFILMLVNIGLRQQLGVLLIILMLVVLT